MYAWSLLRLRGPCLAILVQIGGGDGCRGCRGLGSTRRAMSLKMNMKTWIQCVYARMTNESCGWTRALFLTLSDHGLAAWAVEKGERKEGMHGRALENVPGCLSGQAMAIPAVKTACPTPFGETAGQRVVREYTRP